MKGATIAHAKQRIHGGRYLGLTEPGIIAAEAPNPIVNELVILPDIEKRLEAFVRVGHGIIIFPGGAGTAEEFLYLLGILMHPDNAGLPFPVDPHRAETCRAVPGTARRASSAPPWAKPPSSTTRSSSTTRPKWRRQMTQGLKAVKQFRRERNDAFHFNWLLKIDEGFQRPFDPTHENMANLQLSRDLPPHELAANLRRAFSGIVAGNVKDKGIRLIEQHGPYQIRGDAADHAAAGPAAQSLRRPAPDETAGRCGVCAVLSRGCATFQNIHTIHVRAGLPAIAIFSQQRC